jgi:hypothetical protein
MTAGGLRVQKSRGYGGTEDWDECVYGGGGGRGRSTRRELLRGNSFLIRVPPVQSRFRFIYPSISFSGFGGNSLLKKLTGK